MKISFTALEKNTAFQTNVYIFLEKQQPNFIFENLRIHAFNCFLF